MKMNKIYRKTSMTPFLKIFDYDHMFYNSLFLIFFQKTWIHFISNQIKAIFKLLHIT